MGPPGAELGADELLNAVDLPAAATLRTPDHTDKKSPPLADSPLEDYPEYPFFPKGKGNTPATATADAMPWKRKPVVTTGVVATIFLFLLWLGNTHYHSANGSLRDDWSSVFSPSAPVEAPKSTAHHAKGPHALMKMKNHPITQLMRDAHTRWTQTVSSQSTTLNSAIAKYKKKYRMAPPPLFEQWYTFAWANNHSLVDEYDGLMDDLAPFEKLSTDELLLRIDELVDMPGISIVSIRNGQTQVHSRNSHWTAALAFQQMIAPFVSFLPDMDVPINERPEARILPKSFAFMDDASAVSEPFNFADFVPFFFQDDPEGSTWDSYRRSCPPMTSARRFTETVRSSEILAKGQASTHTKRQLSSHQPLPQDVAFVSGLDSEINFCDNPSFHRLHSAFFSDIRPVDRLYPLFSSSKPPGFADIRIPGFYHWNPSSDNAYEPEVKLGHSREITDLPWDQKRTSVYYRGRLDRQTKSPGSVSGSLQKLRFSQFAQNGVGNVTLLSINTTGNTIDATDVPASVHSTTRFDVSIACDPSLGECQHLQSLGYDVAMPESLSEAWKHKYVMDLDEIAASPRFFALMESKSAVLKSSVLLEFWHDWVVPWKHFIPVSSPFTEINNIMSYFSPFPETTASVPIAKLTTDVSAFDSDLHLKAVALNGRDWRRKYVRKADMEVYVFRLLIEWAALLDPAARDARRIKI